MGAQWGGAVLLPASLWPSLPDRRGSDVIWANAVPEDQESEIKGNMAVAKLLEKAGQTQEAQAEVSKVYMSCSKILQKMNTEW